MTPQWILAHATEFEFGDIKVKYRGKDLWAVTRNECCYDSMEGGFVWEPMPSSRSDEFLATTRFTRDKAIELAIELAKK